MTLLDGDRITPGTEGCTCSHACTFPCWQRIGIAPACKACGCAPFPDDPGEPLFEQCPRCAVIADNDGHSMCRECMGLT